MSNKLFRALRYVKNKPVEISVGIRPEEAAQDNVGDDKAKLVFTTDRRIFLNGEEIARTKGDERPKPIVNKAIPRFPMKGSRYVVRWSNVKGYFYLNIIVAKNVRCDSEEVIDISRLDAKVTELFGEHEIVKILTCTNGGGDNGVGYLSQTYKTSFTPKEFNVNSSLMQVIAQYYLHISNYNHKFFVLRMLSDDILKPDFELEIYTDQDECKTPEELLKHPKFMNEPCASPDYAIMNGNLFCIAMPKTKEMYEMSDVDGLREVLQYNNVYRFEKFKNYVPYDIIGKQGYERKHTLYKRAAWVRTKKEANYKLRHKTYRFYGIKKHGKCREQSIHYVEMYPHENFIKK